LSEDRTVTVQQVGHFENVNWDKAEERLVDMISVSEKLQFESVWFVMSQLGQMKRRYDSGERTQQLYDEIMSIHD